MAQHFTCFLIDDDSDDREIFAMALEDADKLCKCITAKSGIDALQILNADQTFAPDYIFLDLNMPLLPGTKCLMEIKQIPRLVDTPVIIYTTSSHEKDIEESKRLGAAHFLVKAPGLKSLTQMLSAIFRKQTLPFYLNPEV